MQKALLFFAAAVLTSYAYRVHFNGGRFAFYKNVPIYENYSKI